MTKASIRRAMRCMLLCLLGGVSGCTFVRVEGASKMTAKLGIIRLAPAKPNDMVAVTTTGVGLVPTMRGAALGFATEQAVFMADLSSCRVVVFSADKAAADTLRKIVAGRADICYVNGGNHGVQASHGGHPEP